MNHVYFTALVDGAGLATEIAAELADGDAIPRVHAVEPTGAFENDPNVTDKKFAGHDWFFRSRPLAMHSGVVANADDVRRIALSLPSVAEIPSEGFDFRVGNKGFIWSYPERISGQRRNLRVDIAVLYVGDESERQALLLGEPDLFFTAPGYEAWPLVLLRLDAVGVERLEELIADAWHMRAPDEIRAEPR